MTSRSERRMSPPQYVYNSYKEIRDSELIRNKVLTDDSIASFQHSLNKSQPISDDEVKMRSFIQYLYRKNPTNFCKFLSRSKLNHLILWTEAKCIVMYFGLRGIVYVKWNDSEYECSLHRNATNNLHEQNQEHPSVRNVYNKLYEQPRYANKNQKDRRGTIYSRFHRNDNLHKYHDSRKNYNRTEEPQHNSVDDTPVHVDVSHLNEHTLNKDENVSDAVE